MGEDQPRPRSLRSILDERFNQITMDLFGAMKDLRHAQELVYTANYVYLALLTDLLDHDPVAAGYPHLLDVRDKMTQIHGCHSKTRVDLVNMFTAELPNFTLTNQAEKLESRKVVIEALRRTLDVLTAANDHPDRPLALASQ
jgi:hypothetical protein